MKYLVLLTLMCFGTLTFAQKKYAEFSDSNRVELLSQTVKNNTIDVSGFIQRDTLLRRPVFLIEKNKKTDKKEKKLKFPLDTAKNFEIEIEVKLEDGKGVIQLWGAARKDIKDPSKDKEDDILYQMDLWSDGIYNVLQKTYKEFLIGISDLKVIKPFDPERRRITIRKVNKGVQFFVNKNLILEILPPDPVNEIGLTLEGKGIEIEKVKISYLVK